MVWMSLLVCVLVLHSQTATAVDLSKYSAPAIPLGVRSPAFSVWTSARNASYTAHTQHWTGAPGRIAAAVRVNNVTTRLVGLPPGVDPISSSVVVGATQTVLSFTVHPGARVNMTFTSPMFPDDIEALSDPTVYVSFSVAPLPPTPLSSIEVFLDVTGELLQQPASQSCTNDDSLTWMRVDESIVPSLLGGRIGKRVQEPLCQDGDRVRGGWGWQYLVADPAAPSTASLSVCVGCALTPTQETFNAQGTIPNITEAPSSQPQADNYPTVALAWSLTPPPTTATATATATAIWAVDSILEIGWYDGVLLPPLWRRNLPINDTAVVPSSMLTRALARGDELQTRSVVFDAELAHNTSLAGGDSLAFLSSIAYRQTFGAGGLVWHPTKRTVWSFLKECSTNGDLSTTDVIFPEAPQLVLYAPWMLAQQLIPHFELDGNHTSVPFTNQWTSHQLGKWPLAVNHGQEDMPVEVTADMALMLASVVVRTGGSLAFLDAVDNAWQLIRQWATYLTSNLPVIPSQIDTNDFVAAFAGRLNLLVKGTLGVASLSWLLRLHGDTSTADTLCSLATKYAEYYNAHAYVGSGPTRHSTLGLLAPNNGTATYAYKYNLQYLSLLPDNVTACTPFNMDDVGADADWYRQHAAGKYGLYFDSNHTVTGGPTWEMMYSVGVLPVRPAHAQWMWDTAADAYSAMSMSSPMPDMFDADSLAIKGNMRNRPTVGEVFAPTLWWFQQHGMLWDASDMPPVLEA